jgi:hypothetical protein
MTYQPILFCGLNPSSEFRDTSTMRPWSTEAVLAFMTLLATLVPITVYLWRKYGRHRVKARQEYGMDLLPHLSDLR